MSNATSPTTVYQLKVVLKGISPMIWRRLLVSGQSSIEDLHYILQIAMGWSDEHLHQFVIHGKRYGVYHRGGISFSDNPKTIRLSDFQWREREKFRYDYDFTDGWQHEIRVDSITYPSALLEAPICLTGKHSVPPEDCGGPWAFLAKRQHYSVGHALDVLSDIRAGGADRLNERYEEIRILYQWLKLEQFDCDQVNRRLQYYANRDPRWMDRQEDINAHQTSARL